MKLSLIVLAAAGFLVQGAYGAKSGAEGTVDSVIENVRTTAYSYGPAHNGRWGNMNAIGGSLKSGAVRSSAADWSKWPVGTRFRVQETGQEYIVDDIGSAMVGTGTLDLFTPSESQVWRWGVRRVTVEVLEWGCAERSLRILSERPRKRFRHVREMVASLRELLEG